ncbi:hypothetical protein CsSME_00036370 [Camellia sinensis var. sinensis]
MTKYRKKTLYLPVPESPHYLREEKGIQDDDDDDTSSIIRSNIGPRKAIIIEKLNDLRTRLCEMDNEIHEHDRRLQRMEKNFKAMIYVIVFCVFLHFIMYMTDFLLF